MCKYEKGVPGQGCARQMTSDRSNNSGCLFPFGDDLLALLVFSHILNENQQEEELGVEEDKLEDSCYEEDNDQWQE